MSVVEPITIPPEEMAAAAELAHREGFRTFVYLDATDEVDRADALALTLRVRRAAGDDRVLTSMLPRDPHTFAETVRAWNVSQWWAAAAWAQAQVLASFAGEAVADPDLPASINLRKDHLLGARVQTPWPGAAEESGRARRRQSPPGVPDPTATTPVEIVASAYGGRRR